MAKNIDKVLLCSIFSILIFITLRALNVPLIVSITITCLFFTLFLILIFKIKTNKFSQLSYRDFIIECIKNEDYLISFISEEIFPNKSFKKYEDYFILDNNYYFLNLKFNPISYENILTIYKKAKVLNINKINIITTIKDRKVFNLYKYLDITISIMDLHPIYKKLKKLNLLKKENELNKLDVLNLFLIIFKKSNIKIYIVSSFFMLIMSFLTFYKVYYLSFSLICAILAAISIIVNKIYESKNCLK